MQNEAKSLRGRKKLPAGMGKKAFVNLPIEADNKQAVLKAGQELGLPTDVAVFRHFLNEGLRAEGVAVEL